MNRIAIIGATGAIGRGLIEAAVQHHTEIHVLCRADSNRLTNIPRHPLIHQWQCSLEEMSRFDASSLPQMDCFFFLAWDGTYGAVARDDMTLQTKNIQYALDAVHLAKRLGCHTFVGAGSQAEYGRVEGILRADTPCNPENGYGMAKLCAGQMTRVLCKSLGIRHEWARFLSVYGPCDNPRSVVSYAIKTCLEGKRPSFTKGEQLWDYLYSKDAGEALYQIGESGIDGEIYPVGSGRVYPLRTFLESVCKTVNADITPLFGEISYMKGQVMHLQADISKLQADTGFTPQTSFEDGIKETIDWYRWEHNHDNV